MTCVTAGALDSAPPSATHQVSDLAAVTVHHLESIVPAQLLAEDAEMAAISGGPQRFASPKAVHLTPEEHGVWEPLASGGRLWRLRIAAPNATDLNFGFTRFHLPEGATLHVVSEEHDVVRGPYGAADNREHGELWTPVVPGERAVIELYVPADPQFEPEVELATIGRGYRDLFKTRFKSTHPVAKQGDCNVDVACPEGDPWRREIQSVAVYSVDGYMACSGVLIMDAPNSFRPLFLTAAHCGVDATNDHTVVTYWNFQSPECGQLGDGVLDQTVSGSTLLAARADVDFALLELDEAPPNDYDAWWTGWDRRADRKPQGGVCVHHPNADEKAISINEDPLTISSSCIASTEDHTHWDVDNWEIGTTEPGSSGGGLWDPATRLLIGILSGGTASCDNLAGHDCFGRIAAAWDGPVPDERLRDWLDPNGTGVEMTFGGRPAKGIRFPLPRPVAPKELPFIQKP